MVLEPKLNALPGTTLAVFKEMALGSIDEVEVFKPAYDWKPCPAAGVGSLVAGGLLVCCCCAACAAAAAAAAALAALVIRFFFGLGSGAAGVC